MTFSAFLNGWLASATSSMLERGMLVHFKEQNNVTDILQWSDIQAYFLSFFLLLLSENWTLHGSLFHLFAECIFWIFTMADFLTVRYVGCLSRAELIKQMKRESQHRVQHKVHFIKFLGAGGITECVWIVLIGVPLFMWMLALSGKWRQRRRRERFLQIKTSR